MPIQSGSASCPASIARRRNRAFRSRLGRAAADAGDAAGLGRGGVDRIGSGMAATAAGGAAGSTMRLAATASTRRARRACQCTSSRLSRTHSRGRSCKSRLMARSAWRTCAGSGAVACSGAPPGGSPPGRALAASETFPGAGAVLGRPERGGRCSRPAPAIINRMAPRGLQQAREPPERGRSTAAATVRGEPPDRRPAATRWACRSPAECVPDGRPSPCS